MSRREMLGAVAAGAGTLGAAASGTGAAEPAPRDRPVARDADAPLDLRFAVKDGMIRTGGSLVEKFRLLKELGYDGVEYHSPTKTPQREVVEASEASGLPVHGVVDSVHWRVRLSDPEPDRRAEGRAHLENAIRDSKAFGGSSVLLVPGRVTGEDETARHVWDRSIEEIRKVLPLAAEFGIMILIENVWNGFGYEHDGPGDQSADQFAAYIDAIDSPWVGMYFDLGNHRKYGRVEEWVRTLGSRIVKLDVKDWGPTDWAGIGEGSVDWPAVRRALAEVGFTGWCTAEVGGGDRDRLADIKLRMDRVLRGTP